MDMIDINLTGVWRSCVAAIPHIKAGGRGGSIILTSSAAGLMALGNLAHYVAAKHGVVGLMRTLALELAPHQIRVNCVAPGAIETARTQAEAPDYAKTWGDVTPLRRVGTPEDIAGPVLFLAGPQSSFVSGQTIWVDGGVFSQAFWPYRD